MRSAPAASVAQPVSEGAGHDEAHDGGVEPTVITGVGVGGVALAEATIEFGREIGAGGRFHRAGAEFYPPLVTAAGAGGAVGKPTRGDMNTAHMPATRARQL